MWGQVSKLCSACKDVQLALECARKLEILFGEQEHRLWSRNIFGIIACVKSTSGRCPKYGEFEVIHSTIKDHKTRG